MEYTEIYEETAEVEEIADEVEEVQETEGTSFSELLEDPELFNRYLKGDYTYEENEFGKHAYGYLMLEAGERDLYAQRTLPGKEKDDDAGHLIGARFNGAGGWENLDPQERSLNRCGGYKALENEWADALKDGDKVYVDVQTYHSNGSLRPDAWMGYSIRESDDGAREWEAFSYANVSTAEQEEWEKLVEAEDFRPVW